MLAQPLEPAQTAGSAGLESDEKTAERKAVRAKAAALMQHGLERHIPCRRVCRGHGRCRAAEGRADRPAQVFHCLGGDLPLGGLILVEPGLRRCS